VVEHFPSKCKCSIPRTTKKKKDIEKRERERLLGESTSDTCMKIE
jgi:hypothetical protein